MLFRLCACQRGEYWHNVPLFQENNLLYLWLLGLGELTLVSWLTTKTIIDSNHLMRQVTACSNRAIEQKFKTIFTCNQCMRDAFIPLDLHERLFSVRCNCRKLSFKVYEDHIYTSCSTHTKLNSPVFARRHMGVVRPNHSHHTWAPWTYWLQCEWTNK